MEAVIQSLLSGFPVLILHFLVAVAMLAAGISIYHLITPYHEIQLIRQGNIAAAISLSGAVLGLGIPLAFCLAASVNALDILIWGFVTLVIQLACYRIADLVLKDLPKRIVDGEIGAALWLMSVKLSVAALNAAVIAG
ncbi:MAG: DUF350 domain-containing protein [Gammaproteobacteria bacterium]|nr:DUF350 domain-containing protein [Gammaproteobacteria bacterium]